MKNNDTATIRCGSFIATVTGYNRWRFTCDWLPEFDREVECTQATAGRLVIQLQAENRKAVAA